MSRKVEVNYTANKSKFSKLIVIFDSGLQCKPYRVYKPNPVDNQRNRFAHNLFSAHPESRTARSTSLKSLQSGLW